MELLFGQALLFEVMEDMLKALFSKPSSCFFDAIAIGNTIKSNGCVFHNLS
jgi:hypothetical protein